jgi:hypothetical protein
MLRSRLCLAVCMAGSRPDVEARINSIKPPVHLHRRLSSCQGKINRESALIPAIHVRDGDKEHGTTNVLYGAFARDPLPPGEVWLALP